MLFFLIELTFIIVLISVLVVLYGNDRSSAKNKLPQAIMEEYWNGRERRKFVRFKQALEVSYLVKKKSSIKNGKSVDLSEGGMKLLLDEKLAKGTIINLRIGIPETRQTAEAEGEVVWCEEAAGNDPAGKRLFHSGIKFSILKEPHAKTLIDYIRSIALDFAV